MLWQIRQHSSGLWLNPRYAIVLGTVLLLLWSSGCNSTRYLAEDETLMRRSSFVYEGKLHLPRRTLQRQLPLYNKGVFFAPRWLLLMELYQSGLKRYDVVELKAKRDTLTQRFDAKLARHDVSSNRYFHLEARKDKRIANLTKRIEKGNIWMRIGEPLALYDTVTTPEIAGHLTKYLRSQGYLDAQVSLKVRTKKQHTRFAIRITPGVRYTIAEMAYDYADSLTQAQYAPLLEPTERKKRRKNKKKGIITLDQTPYSEPLLENIVDDIDVKVRSQGYYAFSKEYVHFWIDTTSHVPDRVGVYAQITPLLAGLQQYRIDSIRVQVADSVGVFVPYEGMTFTTSLYHTTLMRRILLRNGELYNLQHTRSTRYLLERLNMFNQIGVRYDTTDRVDAEGKRQLNATITLLAKRKYVLSSEWGFEVRQGLPSPFLSVSLQARNLLRSLEILSLSTRFLLDGVGTPDFSNRPYRSFEWGFTLNLLYPDLLLPFRRKTPTYYIDRRTRITYDFLSSNRLEFRRNISELSVAFSWVWPYGSYIEFAPINIRLVSAAISPSFRQQVQRFYNNFSNSFLSGLVTSMRLSGVWNDGYQFATLTPSTGTNVFITAETGGHLGFLYKDLTDRYGLLQYVFSRFSVEYKRRQALGRNIELAFRSYGGVVLTHTSEPLFPYETFFFAGGSNTHRGWPARRLGPGGYTLPEGIQGSIEQPGELGLEVNLEFRLLLASWIGVAAFADVGNIWLLRLNNPVPSASFTFPNSFKDIAISTGFGVRMNISVLLLRLDLGIKTYDPSESQGDRWVIKDLHNGNFFAGKRLLQVNFGIGYPF